MPPTDTLPRLSTRMLLESVALAALDLAELTVADRTTGVRTGLTRAELQASARQYADCLRARGVM